jgi:hypothetical protein
MQKVTRICPDNVGAFTIEECNVVNKWVENGGALLLIADHHPFGLANSSLARSFGVEMGCGSVKDTINSDRKDKGQIEFTREDGLLKNHRITTGYNEGEEIDKVVTFTGQSLSGTGNTKSLLTFSESAMEIRPDSVWTNEAKNYVKFAGPRSVEGLSQAIAIEYGRGRVVILGEAAMLTAQKLFLKKFGMNYSNEADNKQLALNIMHWLTENKDL